MFARLQEAMSGAKKKKVSVVELRSLHTLLSANLEVTTSNTSIVIESLRSVAEILIWGDQNDPKVFEFFLEKNMIGFFDQIMEQDIDSVNVQLLQTMVLLLDNINTPTSIWYMLSNNHMNSIITHKFDFAQEEVLAYYISFLRSLSMRMTSDTILFFHNEHLPDFPLYAEAVKYLNHNESMVRVAVRTLTLSIFRAAIDNEMTAAYLTAVAVPPYFANLVWVVGNLSVEMDACLNDATHEDKGRLGFYVDEHLDLFCYINDVIDLNFIQLSRLLTEQLLDSLLIPLYVHRLQRSTDGTDGRDEADSPERSIGTRVALFLTAHAFLVFDHPPIINTLAATILMDNPDLGVASSTDIADLPFGIKQRMEEDAAALVATNGVEVASVSDITAKGESASITSEVVSQAIVPEDEQVFTAHGTTDRLVASTENAVQRLGLSVEHKRIMVYDLLACTEDDVVPLLAMVLLHGLINNRGTYSRLLRETKLDRPSVQSQVGDYNKEVVGRLIDIVLFCTNLNNKVRLITLQLAIKLIQSLTMCPPEETVDDPGAMGPPRCIMIEEHSTKLREANDFAIAQLAQMYEKHGAGGADAQENFLDTFEAEFSSIKTLKVPLIMNQGSVLLSPAASAVPGLNFDHRCPANDAEKLRRAIQIFLASRKQWLAINRQAEETLPLHQPTVPIAVRDNLDLNNSDLIACNVISRGKSKQLMQVRRFMMVDRWRLVLMEPSSTDPGWGIVRFLANLNNVVACPESHNTRALQVVIREKTRVTNDGVLKSGNTVMFSGRFVFDDHIRCVAALQYLERGRSNLRTERIELLEQLMGMRPMSSDSE